MKEVNRLKDEMEGRGLKPDVYTYTALIHGKCTHEKIDYAQTLFNEMSSMGLVPNVITYTAMISGFSKEGKSDEAFALYDQMIQTGLTPDNKVFYSEKKNQDVLSVLRDQLKFRGTLKACFQKGQTLSIPKMFAPSAQFCSYTPSTDFGAGSPQLWSVCHRRNLLDDYDYGLLAFARPEMIVVEAVDE
ncbi:hypothetical protein Cgig2_030880 [Carnegiea gigantea]|uniref:Pentatricopeptide repeat-containing protein n=1 Tax=Carnegiea gigantea TaxID=171969 RepID=A0A9Q1QI66_9CARY|nr:hypothetical protein Cgig2_030880 [Carnegiea gigantea]